jgi:dihydroxyacetone kinase-like protein
MKKFVNRVDDVLVEALRGFAAAHRDLVRVQHEPTFVARAAPTRAGKVAVVSGGGSGHEPMHAGFVGLGMLDAACPGQVFTSPTPDQMLAAAQAVDSGAGVLFIVKNYEGDVMNFEMAAEMFEGRQASVVTNDDVAVEDSLYTAGRRGVAGTVIVEKIVGAAAEAGADLDALQALGVRVNEHPVHGRGADLLHRPGRRPPDLRDR